LGEVPASVREGSVGPHDRGDSNAQVDPIKVRNPARRPKKQWFRELHFAPVKNLCPARNAERWILLNHDSCAEHFDGNRVFSGKNVSPVRQLATAGVLFADDRVAQHSQSIDLNLTMIARLEINRWL
jgi:hypothetical protein